jgi:demethylmenaquinone methyltransferase/2-methoxy-6-polyprenyl-1,4-benzoquinol methylase
MVRQERMSKQPEERRPHFVRAMFARISQHYDLLNRLMTFGQDIRWRRQAVQRLHPANPNRLLDAGTGTGDLAFEILRRAPKAMVVALDFTPEMIALGRARMGSAGIYWVLADAMQLPFSSQTFDGVISGFLLRNLEDVDQALQEQGRVLRSGGTIVSLEAVAAEKGRRSPIVRAYFKTIIPLLGRLVAGDDEAYNYLPASMDAFLSARELCERLIRAGFASVDAVTRMFGTIGIHGGSKSDDRVESISRDA